MCLIVCKLRLIALVQIFKLVFLLGFMREVVLLVLESLIEVTDLSIQILDTVAVVDRVLSLRADSRSRGTATPVLNVRRVKVAARLHYLLDLGTVLLILDSLNVKLAT